MCARREKTGVGNGAQDPNQKGWEAILARDQPQGPLRTPIHGGRCAASSHSVPIAASLPAAAAAARLWRATAPFSTAAQMGTVLARLSGKRFVVERVASTSTAPPCCAAVSATCCGKTGECRGCGGETQQFVFHHCRTDAGESSSAKAKGGSSLSTGALFCSTHPVEAGSTE